MSAERLQKVLARAGVASRRQVEELIRLGRVTVNGRVAQLGDRAELERDAVKVDGKRVRPPRPERRYLLLNKPDGYVSTVDDPEGRPTVLDLLPQRLRPGVVPVGRLDYHTEGLLLLTDDGDFAQRVAHPRYGCAKTYEVKVKGRPAPDKLRKLRGGLVIDGRRTAPAEVSALPGHQGPRDTSENTWWRLVLTEGRTRQIREMFFRLGHPVSRLRRVAIGPLSAPELPRGAWRELSEDEVRMLRSKAARRSPRAAPASGGRSGNRRRTAPPRPGGPRQGGPRKGGPRKGGTVPGGPRPGGPRQGGPRQGGASTGGPRQGGARPDGPRPDGPRKSGPRPDGPRKGGPRKGGPRPGGPRRGGRGRGQR